MQRAAISMSPPGSKAADRSRSCGSSKASGKRPLYRGATLSPPRSFFSRASERRAEAIPLDLERQLEAGASAHASSSFALVLAGALGLGLAATRAPALRAYRPSRGSASLGMAIPLALLDVLFAAFV